MGSERSRTYSAVIICDPPAFGGAVTIIVDGKSFRVRGPLKRGLQSLDKKDSTDGR